MSDIVGYTVDDNEIYCLDCVIGREGYFEAIYEEEAVERNLSCHCCGEYLFVPDYDEDMPDECPNCGRDQYFMEVLEDNSVECRCGWNNGDKPSFEEWKKQND